MEHFHDDNFRRFPRTEKEAFGTYDDGVIEDYRSSYPARFTVYICVFLLVVIAVAFIAMAYFIIK